MTKTPNVDVDNPYYLAPGSDDDKIEIRQAINSVGYYQIVAEFYKTHVHLALKAIEAFNADKTTSFTPQTAVNNK